MVDYEFQARRIGRMSDYIDRRTATLGLHAACLEQQARELRRDAENMRRVVIGGSVDDPARMAEDAERLLAALRRLESCMQAAACARAVLHVFEDVDKDRLRDENADTDGTANGGRPIRRAATPPSRTRAGALNTSTVGTASGTWPETTNPRATTRHHKDQ
ncbi:hypothetical protein DWX12_10065 [Bifidobacterium pseudocatenulatum]|nr:hypothetical protein DWX12_10065 [Bifidobacterium pseudocatenulatum]